MIWIPMNVLKLKSLTLKWILNWPFTLKQKASESVCDAALYVTYINNLLHYKIVPWQIIQPNSKLFPDNVTSSKCPLGLKEGGIGRLQSCAVIDSSSANGVKIIKFRTTCAAKLLHLLPDQTVQTKIKKYRKSTQYFKQCSIHASYL